MCTHVSVVTPSQSKCTTAATIDASSRSGDLTSVTSSETGCGLAGAPWILETVAGQNISLTFLLFAWQPHNSDDTQSMRDCPVKYGYVIDLATQSTVELCGQAGLKRHQQQVLVNSNRLQIVVDRDHLNTGAFLIHYQGKTRHQLDTSAFVIHYQGKSRHVLDTSAFSASVIIRVGRTVQVMPRCVLL